MTIFGDYFLRQCNASDVPTLAALEHDCQVDPWPPERIEAFLEVPHDGCEQFGTLADLNGQAVGYALLMTGGGNMAIDRIKAWRR